MYALLPLLCAAVVAASPLEQRDTVTSTVNLGNNTGSPQHLASGFIYGIPDTPNQIPDHFYTNIGFNYARAGGAQVPTPGRGWIWGLSEYKVRFASALSNYKTARKYNANFIFLIHDLWGADGTQNSTAPYPGDNGDWTSWDNYLTQFISDMKSNDAITGLSIDIWNEPDLTYFWNAPQAQYIQMWGRTYHRLRKEWPSVKLTGPAFAGQPDPTNNWWTNFLSFVASNSSVPDQYVWHMEGGGGDMEGAYGALFGMLQTYKLPVKPLNIDEYATFPEQVPAGSAWWISQLERVNAHGLRGNWLSGWELHDLMGSLVSKPNADNSNYSPTAGGYYANGDYQVYQYYNLNMTGYRVGTSPSTDLKLDTYATVGKDMVRVLTGVRITTGTWQITINDLSSVGLPSSGSLNIHTWGFPSGGHYAEVDVPNDLGWYSHTYSGNSVMFPVYQTDKSTAYAFEFYVG
ncbi:glycoside hydrolase family 39 protein [Hyaloscypha hepaticicola]|uniref:Glycoside hydrolase family 39 protein n=1 Tax=Hyaloscypha hepaticicola TaxID=2082293 RepID=A0A2J6QD64_9HELO|nr:glycoside hydrolase family 39 protein [Hyaloscypha hepaticicola]